MLAAAILACGCGRRVGSTATFDSGGRPSFVNGSPVTLSIEDSEKRGFANGIGPARFTSITGEEVQTFQTGTTPRDLFLSRNPDGTIQFNLSSGTDVTAEGVKVDPSTGAVTIAKFGTSSSEPLRAGAEAYEALTKYWAARDEASKQAIIAELETVKATAPTAAGVIEKIIATLTSL
jgi:hypothetical protein